VYLSYDNSRPDSDAISRLLRDLQKMRDESVRAYSVFFASTPDDFVLFGGLKHSSLVYLLRLGKRKRKERRIVHSRRKPKGRA
jgi:hypothetical protein